MGSDSLSEHWSGWKESELLEGSSSIRICCSSCLEVSNSLSFSRASILFSITMRRVSSSTMRIAADNFFTRPIHSSIIKGSYLMCASFPPFNRTKYLSNRHMGFWGFGAPKTPKPLYQEIQLIIILIRVLFHYKL